MKVNLNEVIKDLDFTNDEIEYYYKPKNGEITMLNSVILKDSNEEQLDEVFTKNIMLPTKYDINEYKMMEDFIKTVKDLKIQNQLYISINGHGAFRRFKDTCIYYSIINNWYKFRNEQYKKLAINWCKENNIEFE